MCWSVLSGGCLFWFGLCSIIGFVHSHCFDLCCLGDWFVIWFYTVLVSHFTLLLVKIFYTKIVRKCAPLIKDKQRRVNAELKWSSSIMSLAKIESGQFELGKNAFVASSCMENNI